MKSDQIHIMMKHAVCNQKHSNIAFATSVGKNEQATALKVMSMAKIMVNVTVSCMTMTDLINLRLSLNLFSSIDFLIISFALVVTLRGTYPSQV